MLPLLLCSTHSRSLRSNKTTSVTPEEGADTIDAPVSDDAFRWNLSVRELESVISAVDVCSSAIWHKPLLEHQVELPESDLSSPDMEWQQAVLTEHMIRNGPRWTARMLGHKLTHTSEQRTQDSSGVNAVNVLSLWLTSKADAARLAAEGVARLLWMDRTVKIEDEIRRRDQGKLKKLKISDMRVGPGGYG
jgi:hypothetical protein